MIGDPLELGAIQETKMFGPEIVVVGAAGGEGRSAAKIDTGYEVKLKPYEFSDCTVNEYVVPGVRPVIR